MQRRVEKKAQDPKMGPWTPRELVHWTKGNIKGKLLFNYRAFKLIYYIHLININTDQKLSFMNIFIYFNLFNATLRTKLESILIF